MPSLSRQSLNKLDTCHYLLQDICKEVIKTYDFTVLEGHRSNERQEELFRQGKSKLRAGGSKHNMSPSHAVDIAPYPIDWQDMNRFFLLAGFMFQASTEFDIELRWGMDWNRNWIHTDQSFFDAPHYEIVL